MNFLCFIYFFLYLLELICYLIIHLFIEIALFSL